MKFLAKFDAEELVCLGLGALGVACPIVAIIVASMRF